MPCFTIALSLCLGLSQPASAQNTPPGYGTVSGTSASVVLLSAPSAPPPPPYENDGFRQTVDGGGGKWRVAVEVDARPLKVRAPFRPGKISASVPLSPQIASALSSALARCQRADEAVEAVLLVLRERIRYTERASFSETEKEVAERGEASCVGMTRLAVAILQSLGIGCREVVGFKLPAREGPIALEGGLLHAWMEVSYPEGQRVFCDPWRSSGWVPETYLVLRVGGGFDPGALSSYTGGAARFESHRDRLFYEPGAGVSSVLWKRGQGAVFTGTLLTGKVLGPLDMPLEGAARLEGSSSAASMPLWEGNFFFRDLEPAVYALSVSPLGAPAQTAPVRLNPMDRRTLLFYSQGPMVGASGAKQ